MKIGLTAKPFLDINNKEISHDGMGVYTKNLYQELSRLDCNVRKIYYKSLKQFFIQQSASDLIIKNSPILSLLLPGIHDKFNGAIDLLHVTDYVVPDCKDVPVVSTVYDAIVLKHPNWVSKKNAFLRHLRNKVFSQLAKNHITHAITISQTMVADIVNYWGIPEEKVSVVYPGLCPTWYECADDATKKSILAKYHLPEKFFLTVGTLQPRKNIERILDAFDTLPPAIKREYKLVIVGGYNKNLTSKCLLDRISSAGDAVVWLRYLPFSELQVLCQAASVFLFPSLEEGFGLPILEAFASKTPVITSNNGAMAEVAAGNAYLVDPLSTEHISHAMAELADKQAVGAELACKGYERSRAFTWEKCAKETMNIYQKIL